MNKNRTYFLWSILMPNRKFDFLVRKSELIEVSDKESGNNANTELEDEFRGYQTNGES